MSKGDDTIAARRKLVSDVLVPRMQALLKEADAAKDETQMVPIAGAVLVLDQPGGPKALVAFGNLPPNLDPQTFEKALTDRLKKALIEAFHAAEKPKGH